MPFFGQILRDRRVGGLRVLETEYAHGAELSSHAHTSPHAALVISGEVVEACARRSVECKPLSLLVRRAGDEHANRFRGPTRCLTLEATSSDALVRVDEPRAFADGGPAVGAAVRLLSASREAAWDPLEIESLALEVLASAAPSTPASADRSPWLARVTELLEDRFPDRVTLSELSAAAGVHAVHVARTFRRVHRMNVGAFVRRRRAEHAARLLVRSGRPLAHVAVACGFSDQAHLTRVFRREFGTSPARFRRQLGAE
jgi:AraC family transcriptional regulator